MNLPNKLPPVRGTSALSRGFRMTWQTINGLIDYCQSVTLKPGVNGMVRRTPSGTPFSPDATSTEATSSDSDGGRWA